MGCWTCCPPIYKEYPNVDGLYSDAATLPAYRSVMLFERPRRTPADLLAEMPLRPGLRPALKRTAWVYGMRLVL